MFRKKERNIEGHKSHLKNLIVLANADGHIATVEEHLLIAIAHSLGLTEEDVKEIYANIDAIDFVLPHHFDDRIEQLNDLFTLISIDGHIDENEIEMCRAMANKYELPHTIIEELIKKYS